ncbi:hypothetical protein [Thermococcus sp.]|uniref:hypothetical protein n=1 Tax=Thermococcus sp. TaxID=35749 RepID=UPI0026301FD9|nr:hypothetical protein [Thermococcus sp.]
MREILEKIAEALEERYDTTITANGYLKARDCWPSFEEDYEKECDHVTIRLTPLQKGVLVEVERFLFAYDAVNFAEEQSAEYYPFYVPKGHEEDIPALVAEILGVRA